MPLRNRDHALLRSALHHTGFLGAQPEPGLRHDEGVPIIDPPPQPDASNNDDADTSRGRQVRQGALDSLGVGLGIFPLGLALGMLVVQAGLPGWLAPALSIGVFAGSVELLLVSMIATATPLITIAITVFAVNFRHVFYPLTFPVQVVKPGIGRAYSIYAMIDEAYATYVLMPPEKLSSARMLTGQLLMQAYWVAGSLAGVLIGSLLPEPIEGFEFALVALFIVMALDAVRSRREIPSVALAGAAVAVALVVFPGSEILAALCIFTVLLVARYLWTRRGRKVEGEDPHA